MEPFAEYLIAMGYPEDRLRDPRDGSMSRNSFGDSEQLAGELAWYYESDGMMPLLIGHSQGGMLAIKVLYELNGSFHRGDSGVESADWRAGATHEHRRSADGSERPVVGSRFPTPPRSPPASSRVFCSASGAMMGKLRAIPDTVEDFTGFSIEWDMIAGTPPGSEEYHADGSAQVRNVELSATTSHIRMPRTRYLTRNAATRAWIDDYDPAVAHGAAARRAGRRQRQHSACGGHLVQRQDALVHRSAAPDQGTPRRSQVRRRRVKGRLNLFQAAMVRWREMHPYNAVHVVTLSQPLDLSRLEASIRRQLEGLGLTGLMLDRRRLRYEWTGGAARAPLVVLAGGAIRRRACKPKWNGS